jgi:hypothetical protein
LNRVSLGLIKESPITATEGVVNIETDEIIVKPFLNVIRDILKEVELPTAVGNVNVIAGTGVKRGSGDRSHG